MLAATAILIGLMLGGGPAAAQEDHSTLTRAKFRNECLFCHSRAAPEGVAPEIMAGFRPVAGLKPRDAMPTLICRRRCEHCGSAIPATPR